MKRYLFSRARFSASPKKDQFDPDQRPITMGRIVQPRVFSTMNYFDSFEQNKKRRNSSTLKNNATQPINFGGFIYRENEEMAEKDGYSPPEIIIPQNNDVVSRFIKTSHVIDRMPGHQSSLIDDEHRKNDANKSIKREFLTKYLLDNTKEENAYIIQRAFRLHEKRRNFRMFININLNIRRNLTKLTFLSWRLYTSNDPEILKKDFSKLSDVYNYFVNRFSVRKLSPFKLFYVTNQLFLPEGYSADFIYQYFYLMNIRNMVRVIKEWARVAKLRHKHRLNLAQYRFSTKKFTSFGIIYHMFIMWQRYAEWNREARNNPKKNYITLNKTEISVLWNIKETNLNSKRNRINRATEFSIKRVSAKAIRALFNRSIQAFTEMAINQNADIFYNRHLQSLAHRAWLKHMQKRLQELQVLRDSMRSWYAHAYEMSKQKQKIQLAVILSKEHFLLNVMNNWFKAARMMRMRRVKMMLRIQRKPSSMFMIIFALRNEFELSFQTFCFRMWIRFAKARRKWKYFCRWCHNPNKDKETKIIVLGDLRRAAHMKLVRRGFTGSFAFLPRHTWVSLDLTLNAINQINLRFKMLESCNKMAITHNTDYNPEPNNSEVWKFLTEEEFGKKPTNVAALIEQRAQDEKKLQEVFKSEVLIRCFLVELHKTKKYELLKLGRKKYSSNNVHYTELHSLDELEEQANRNISILRRRTFEKVRRDHAVLSSFVSHVSANEMKNVLKDFTINEEKKSILTIESSRDMQKVINGQDLQPTETILVYPDFDESIKELIRKNEIQRSKLKSTFNLTRDKVMSRFYKRLRDPNTVSLNSKTSSADGESADSSFAMTLNQNAFGNNKPVNNPLISSYVKPKPIPSKDSALYNIINLINDDNDINNNPFSFPNLKKVLERMPSVDDISSSLVSFFHDVCNIQIEITEVKTLAKFDDLCGDLEQSLRHRMQKNVAMFIADILGLPSNKPVPLKLSAPKIAIDCISAIFTVHNAIKKTSLAQYCDECPFASKLRAGDYLLISTQEKAWNALKGMFPGKIELPTEGSPLLNLTNLTKRRSVYSSSMFQITGSAQSFEETLGSNEAYLSCFVLPYLFDFDSVTDFVREEMISRKAQEKKTNSS